LAQSQPALCLLSQRVPEGSALPVCEEILLPPYATTSQTAPATSATRKSVDACGASMMQPQPLRDRRVSARSIGLLRSSDSEVAAGSGPIEEPSSGASARGSLAPSEFKSFARVFALPLAFPTPCWPSLLRGMRSFERSMVEKTRAYFSADLSNTVDNNSLQLLLPTERRSSDPLVELVHRDPDAALLFIKAVMIFSTVGGMLVCISSAIFLSLYWSQCGSCDRPLRWWLIVHSILQLSQLPVRIVFLMNLRGVDAEADDRLLQCVEGLTSSPAWQTSKHVSLMTYGWFVLGIVWVMNAGSCVACPGLYQMTVAVVAQAIARAVVALIFFRFLFPHVEAAADEPPMIEAATSEMIADLPVVCFRSAVFEAEASCAVCLAEYVDGDQLRKFPCGHHFHQGCADQWLHRNKRCPLCMGPIDAPRSTDAK